MRLFLIVLVLLCPAFVRAQLPGTTPASPAIQAEEAFIKRMGESPDPTPKETRPPTRIPVAKKETEPKAQGDGDSGDDADADDASDPEIDEDADAGDDTTAGDADDDDGSGETTDDIKAALSRQGVKVSLEDIEKTAGEKGVAYIKQREKEMQAGFTRAMQDARSYRASEQKARAEEAFRTAQPAQYVVQMVLANPEIAEQVNAILDEIGASPTAKKAHEIVVRDARAQAVKTVTDADAAQEARSTRADQIESYAQKSAQKAGVPFGLGVEEAVANHILAHGDITEADVDKIVAAKAKEYTNHVRAHRREASREQVQAKVGDRKTAGLKVKPGSGSPPAPAGKATPKTESEFVEHMLASLPG